jgi:hypothetical protein
MCARASVSSSSMKMNWDDEQHAVHVPHGTSADRSPRSTARISSTQDEVRTSFGNSGYCTSKVLHGTSLLAKVCPTDVHPSIVRSNARCPIRSSSRCNAPVSFQPGKLLRQHIGRQMLPSFGVRSGTLLILVSRASICGSQTSQCNRPSTIHLWLIPRLKHRPQLAINPGRGTPVR